MTIFLLFRYRVELLYRDGLAHIVHTRTRKQAEFLGRRWERYGQDRTWDVQKANYKQGVHALALVRFLFKGVRKWTMWVEPPLVALLEEWVTLKLQPARKTAWTVKYDRGDLPF